MANKRKIINDPVFGFINIPNDFLYEIIQHRYFQRLHRIKQLGLSSFVYPGAQHTRMQHSLGALFLTNEAIKELRQKGHAITDDEANGVMAAILLHDIGHGPYSHVLEHTLTIGLPHEAISEKLMAEMNQEFGGALTLAIQIFKNEYPKRFLHQLVSSQLDMDRLDYLRRDSFFTGVTEGVIGSARIIKMLNVADDRLVIEYKGLYSIENFLIARRFMYWQVYLHKTSLAAEKMLTNILSRAKKLSQQGKELFATPALNYFIQHTIHQSDFLTQSTPMEHFVNLDDSDILASLKVWSSDPDLILSTLSSNFINRQLFKTQLIDSPLNTAQREELLMQYSSHFAVSIEDACYFFAEKTVASNTYNPKDDQILILFKDGSTKDISQVSDILNPEILHKNTKKNYLCYYQLNN